MSSLEKIGQLAVQVHQLARATKATKSDLSCAYAEWKEGVGMEYVVAGSEDWAEMMQDTKPAFALFQRARADEKNAKARLDRAIRRFKAGEA